MLGRYDYLSKIIEYIENSISEEIDLEEVAKVGAVSLMQLYRDFYVNTGHSIKEYIRKRRLSNACAMIKYTDTSLVEIALLSGYKTQQSFNKHFKSVLGITPLEYKDGDVYFSFYPYGLENISVLVKVSTETIPKVIRCKYYFSQQKGIENKAISELLEIIKNNNNLCSEKIRLFGRSSKQRENRICYELMVAPSGNIDDWLAVLEKSVFSEISIIDQITDVFAFCTVRNNEQDIINGWNYLYNSWLNYSMFALTDIDCFEEYCFKGQAPNKLKLFMPIKKKSNYRTITLKEMPRMTFLISKKLGINAEKTASECVMNFLRDHYPLIIKEATTFYVSCYDGVYECGVKLDKDINIRESYDVELVKYPEGTYAKINDDCCGDISIHAAQLKYWLGQNGFPQVNQKVFAIYETSDSGFEASDIKMTVYAPIKMLKKDNTNKINFDIVKEKARECER